MSSLISASFSGPIRRFCRCLPGLVFSLLLVVMSGGPSLSAGDDEKEKNEQSAPVEPGKEKESAKTDSPVALNVSRRTLTNFLTDRVALTPYSTGGGSPRPFRGAFVIESPQSQYAVIWHQESCRIVGVVDLRPVPEVPDETGKEKGEDENETGNEDSKSSKQQKETSDTPPSPYVLKASGPFPLAASLQAEGKPSYFGFRMVGDRPEFLYNLENIAVEESIWLGSGGKKMMQRFRLGNREKSDLKLSFPDSWKERIEVKTGEWKDSILIIPKEEAAEFILTYRLDGKGPTKDSTKKDQ